MDAPTLRRVGAALGLWLEGSGGQAKRVVLGNDGRASSPWILDALADGLAATEAVVSDVGLTTTPALSFVTRAEPFSAGVMISASHNPAEDNGVKIFDSNGAKLAAGRAASGQMRDDAAGENRHGQFQRQNDASKQEGKQFCQKYSEDVQFVHSRTNHHHHKFQIKKFQK